MKKSKYTITLKREILNPCERIKEFIFDNINYRRNVWNDFVEKCNEYNHFYEFKPLSYLSEYQKKTDYKKRKNYCEYVDTSVANDFDNTIKQCKRNVKGHNNPHPHFKRFDRFHGSFTVNNRAYKYTNIHGFNHWNSKTEILDTDEIKFKASRNLHLYLKLKESLFHDIIIVNDEIQYIANDFIQNPKTKTAFIFTAGDIKEIGFVYDMKHFYIQFTIDITFVHSNEHKKYKRIAGIDLGLKQPIVLFDSEKFITFAMEPKTIKYIKYLEYRCRKLQKLMDIKYNENKRQNKSPYSKNYNKLRYKFRKCMRKIVNIKDNWRKRVCKFICTSYDRIVVDNFKYPKEASINPVINSKNRFYGMSFLMSYLKYASVKFNCEYIIAKPNSTRICSKCGYINSKLDNHIRIFKCEKCSFEIDRDCNSAINCFKQGIDN